MTKPQQPIYLPQIITLYQYKNLFWIHEVIITGIEEEFVCYIFICFCSFLRCIFKYHKIIPKHFCLPCRNKLCLLPSCSFFCLISHCKKIAFQVSTVYWAHKLDSENRKINNITGETPPPPLWSFHKEEILFKHILGLSIFYHCLLEIGTACLNAKFESN